MWVLLAVNGAASAAMLAVVVAAFALARNWGHSPGNGCDDEGGVGRSCPRPRVPPSSPFDDVALRTRGLADGRDDRLARSA